MDITSFNNRNRISVHSSPRIRPEDGRQSSEGSNAYDSIDKSVDFSRYQENLEFLINSPEVREDIVELGRQLADDPDFPSDEALDNIALALLSPVDEFLSED